MNIHRAGRARTLRSTVQAGPCPIRALPSGEQRSIRVRAAPHGRPFGGLFAQVRRHTNALRAIDSQAYSAGSIPGIRSITKPQVRDPGLLCCPDLSGLACHSRAITPLMAAPEAPILTDALPAQDPPAPRRLGNRAGDRAAEQPVAPGHRCNRARPRSPHPRKRPRGPRANWPRSVEYWICCRSPHLTP